MRLHAILLTLEDQPGPNGHTRYDTIENDIRDAIEVMGYENVTIVSHDVHQQGKTSKTA